MSELSVQAYPSWTTLTFTPLDLARCSLRRPPRRFLLSPRRVEKDLLFIVDHLEAERDREMLQANPSERRELTEEERRAGMELLQSPDLFDRIASDLAALGYVGEELNKQLLYIAASSRKMAGPHIGCDPLAICIGEEPPGGIGATAHAC